ncbi:MAG: hypothetical protein A2Z75_04395 [Chloroflexi bacterium RBG_13_50_10]|nr:MAG: hypothetical protein A2Z75_04395 [Chloroflexi bacterium RBG_13_50_10]
MWRKILIGGLLAMAIIMTKTKSSKIGPSEPELATRKKRKWKVILGKICIYFFMTIGISLYIILSYTEGRVVGFELATISAVVGGLLLASGSIGKNSQLSILEGDIRRTGVLYLAATISFIFIGLFLPLLKIPGIGEWLGFAVVTIVLVPALVFFGWATGDLVILLPQLWSYSREKKNS